MRKVQDHIKIMHSKSASIIGGVECRMQGPTPVKRARDCHISRSVTVAVHVLLDVEVVVELTACVDRIQNLKYEPLRV